jgi:tape measure domain-containing protein
MSQLTSTLKVVVNASGAQSGAAQVTASITAMSNSSNRAINSMNSRMNTFERAMKSANSQLLSLARQALAVTAFYQFSKSIVDATQSYAAFMAISKVSTGSLQGAADSMDYIRKVADRLGVNLETNIKVFGKFQAAMRPMDATGEMTKHIFEGLSVAASGLHLNAYQLELSFKAIEQAASKGKPSLEEFQRQLAEHIPGAMAYLAEGVNLRMDQIHDAISKKTVSVKELLIGFANVLKKRFGEAAEYASQQLPAAIERLRNAFFIFYVEISKKGAADGLKDLTKGLTDLLARTDITQAIGTMFKDVGASIREFLDSITGEDIQTFGAAISSVTKGLVWFVSNISEIFKVLVALLAGNYLGKIAWFFYDIGTKAKAAGVGIGILRTAFIGLRAAMLGPLGILALIGSLIYLLSQLDARKPKPITIDVRDTNGKVVSMNSATSGSFAGPGNASSSKLGGNSMFDKAQKNQPIGGKLSSSDLALVGKNQDMSLEDLLKSMDLPKDATGGGAGGSSGKAKKDPLESFISDTTIAKMKEYSSLLALLEKRKGSMSFEQYANTYQNISDKFVTLVDGAKYFDSSAAEMARSQSDSIAEMQGEISDTIKTAKDWQIELDGTMNSLASAASGDVFGPLFAEVNVWFDEEIKRLKEISGLAPEAVKKIIDSINAVKAAKMDSAQIMGANELLSNSQSIISSKEQSLQSQVIAGLISESQARVSLRKVIGEQGASLTQHLLPVLEEIIQKTTNPQTLAAMQAMVDKIGEMVTIGNQTTGFEGFKAGLREYANEATDVFTEVKDVTIKAFQGMGDALTEYVMTGKADFSSLRDSIIKDMIKIAMQQMVTKPLANMASSMFSSAGSALMSMFLANGGAFAGGQIQAFAKGGVLGPNGGIFPGPTIFPFANGGALGVGGEAGDEAAMPLKRMSSGKLGVYMEGGGASSIAISITVNDNRTQTESKTQGNDNKLAPKLADMVRETVHAKLVQEMRPGGLLA